MTKRKRIVALLVGVLLLAGVVGAFAWLSVTGGWRVQSWCKKQGRAIA